MGAREDQIKRIQQLERINQLQSRLADQGDAPEVVDPPIAPSDTLLQRITRIMNIAPGTTRMAVKAAIDRKLPTPEDYARALTGEQPPSSEMYGVSGPVGFGLDVLQDPTAPALALAGRAVAPAVRLGSTALMRALQPAAEEAAATMLPKSSALRDAATAIARATHAPGAGRAMGRPLSTFVQSMGKGMYKQSLAPLESASPGLTEELFNDGFKTTGGGAGKKITAMVDRILGQNQEIASKASNMTQTPPVDLKAAMTPVRQKAARLATSEIDAPAVERALKWIGGYEKAGESSLNDALFQQSRLRAAAKAAYQTPGGAASVDALLAQAGNRGMGEAIGNSIAQAPALDAEEAAKLYRAGNVKMGKLINAEPAAYAMGGRGMLTPAEAGGLALGFGTGLTKPAAKLVLLKRALQGLGGPTVGTYGGRALHQLGRLPLEPLAVQGAVHVGSPWSLFEEKSK